MYLSLTSLASRPRGLSGLGASTAPQTAQQIASAGVAVTGGIVAALSAASAAGMATGIGAAVAGAVMLATLIYKAFEGCGDTCTITANIANQVEPILQQNLANYLSAPVHYRSLQLAALNNYDTAWSALTSACNNPTYQAAGQRCISDREAGACHYHTTPGAWVNGQWVGAGPDGSGPACWNWFVGYRDPIANDPTVVPDPVVPPAAAGSSLASAVGLNPSTPVIGGLTLGELVLPAGLLLLAAILL